ncbi:MAG: hypothetical protein ABIH37_04785 [archaeon]
MVKKCIICNEDFYEESNKLNGTVIKAKNEKNITEFLHVCSECQNKKDWIEIAKIRGA